MTTSALAAEDAGARAFVGMWVAAHNADDRDAKRALIHPDATACADLVQSSMAEAAFVPKRRRIPADYTWHLQPMPSDTAGWFSDKFDYPVRPTHQLQISYQPAPDRTESVVAQIAKLDETWREVVGCPKPETIVEARQAGHLRVRQNERIRELVMSIPGPLETELRQLITEGRRIDAYRHYRDITKEDLVVAKGVVDALVQAAPNGVKP